MEIDKGEASGRDSYDMFDWKIEDHTHKSVGAKKIRLCRDFV